MTGIGGTYNGLPEFGPFEWPLSLTGGAKRKYKVSSHGDLCCEIRSTRPNSGGKSGRPSVKYFGSFNFTDGGTIVSSTYIERLLHEEFVTYMSEALGMAIAPNARIPQSLFIHGGETTLHGAGAHMMGSVDGFTWFDLPSPYGSVLSTPNEPFSLVNDSSVESVSFNPVSGLTSLVVSANLKVGGSVLQSFISLDGKDWHPGVDTVKLPINRITGFDPGGKTVEVKRTPAGVATSINGGAFSITDRRLNLFIGGIVTIDDNGQDAFISGGAHGTPTAQSSITSSVTGFSWDPYYNDDGSTHPAFQINTTVAGVRG